jgi:large subunit ribosomal protein L6
MSRQLATSVSFQVESGKIYVTCAALGSDGPRLQGLSRALVASMVKGVSDGYERVLELKGTGYRVELKGNVLHFALGFSHPIQFPLPDGVKATIPADSKGTVLILTSADKELIGQTAAVIRGFRPPEPYGGKGVRYRGEKVREKAGKAGKGGKK